MTERLWWSGEESILNEKAVDFIFAMWGLGKAYDRLRESDNDIHLIIECAGGSDPLQRRAEQGMTEESSRASTGPETKGSTNCV